ncbi:MAG TPA: YbaY family lipoprotein, partial [SAR202 cluster bacterium]|nr:YbaY family lipoprotein [SAR202 cluster bacterium]
MSIQPIAPAILAALVEPIAPVMPAQPSNPVAPVGPAAPVEIEAPAIATITGTVAYRERIALTPDSVVEIKLIDVSRMDAPAITIGEQIIVSPGQVPIAFEIEYNPAEIDDRFSYAVQARITQSGKLAFINDTRYSVITRGGPTNVDMVLTKVATSPAQPPDPVIPAMTETRAPIESVELTTSDSNPREYTLHIVSGLPGGCVKFGDYSVAREGAHIDVAVTNFAPTEP